MQTYVDGKDFGGHKEGEWGLSSHCVEQYVDGGLLASRCVLCLSPK
jgi:hypothetical protein